MFRASLGLLLVLSALATVSVSAEPGDNSERGESLRLTRATPTTDSDGGLSAAAAAAIRDGYLPIDRAALAAGKAASVDISSGDNDDSPPAVQSPNPVTTLSWNGIRQVNIVPPDSTGAIGTTRYVETVNSRVGIYDRSGVLIKSSTLGVWWGMGSANVFDPQVIWDPTTRRFYYTGDAVFGTTDHRLAFGFSTTASPNNLSTSWCKYEVGYGSDFPDYPKLGDSRDFAIIGVNVFNSSNFYIGSDIVAIGKPPTGTACPDPASLTLGSATDLAVSGVTQYTPVPANQTDTHGTGWVLTQPSTDPATTLGLFSVTKNLDGSPNVQASGVNIPVPSFTYPLNAPQSGTTFLLDTLDARLTQAVSAIDPLRGNRVGIWTQHTVSGGAGAMVRWYEINPVSQSILQTGTASSASLFMFNGAISPDRVVRGAIRAFGSNMVLGFNTSSSTTYPSINMVSKRGNDGQSAVVSVKTSPGPDIDYSCQPSIACRWGDYAAATPDPAASTAGATGTVWLTSMWNRDGRLTGTSTTAWQTWNWAAQP